MVQEMARRGILQGLAVIGAVGLGGCNFGNQADVGDIGGAGEGDGAGGETPTPEPLSWSEATREVLTESDREALRGTELAPEKIRSRSDAERAFTIVGWHRSIRDLDATQRRQIDELLQRGPEVEQRLSDVESTLRQVESLIGTMKNTDIPLTGQTVWDTAVTLVPSLQGFDTALSEILDELRTWERLLGDVTARVGTVRESIAAVRTGNVERATALGRQTERALSAIDDLESRSSDLRQTLSEYATVTGQVANIAGQLGPLAGEVGSVYGEASRQLDSAASALREFNGLLRGTRSALSTTQSNARDVASRLLSRAEALVGPGATTGGDSGDEPTPTPTEGTTPTETQLPQNPRSDPDFHEGFEESLGEWRGDTGRLEHATDAARGSRAIRVASGHAQLTLAIPEAAGEVYSLWWKVVSDSGGLTATFDADGAALFGMEVRGGPSGLELVVNQATAEAASDLLYAQVRPDTWYNLTFTGVDFGRQEFEAVLYDVGDLELVRAQQSFAGDGNAISALSVTVTGDGPVLLDDVRVS